MVPPQVRYLTEISHSKATFLLHCAFALRVATLRAHTYVSKHSLASGLALTLSYLSKHNSAFGLTTILLLLLRPWYWTCDLDVQSRRSASPSDASTPPCWIAERFSRVYCTRRPLGGQIIRTRCVYYRH